VRAAPLRDVLLDLVRGERVARLRVVQRLREDHAVDLALGRQQGAAGVALTHRRVEGVHVAADRAPVVDVRAVGRDPAADPAERTSYAPFSGKPATIALSPLLASSSANRSTGAFRSGTSRTAMSRSQS